MLDFPATHRNRDVIADVLGDVFSAKERVSLLELASGSGQHVVHFAQRFPNWTFQPTDLESEHIESVDAYVQFHKAENVLPGRLVDVSKESWELSQAYDGILAINLIHISPWEASIGLFKGASQSLSDSGKLYLYGAYRRAGQHTSPSNEAFDRSLRDRNPQWGVRCLDEVITLAESYGFSLDIVQEMPANNLSVVFSLES